MLEEAPKKDIIFIITDSSYVDDVTCNSAFDSCLRGNQDQVIEVDIISERTATKLKQDFLDKAALETSLGSCHEYGLSNIKDKIATALCKKNPDIVKIYTPYSLHSLVPNDNTLNNDSTNDSSTHQDLSESYVSIEKAVLEKTDWDSFFSFNKTKELQDLNGIKELQDLLNHDKDFNVKVKDGKYSNVKEKLVELCLKNLNDEKKEKAIKIYIDKEPKNLLHFYNKYPDVICVFFNDKKKGEDRNKVALDLAIKAANSNSGNEFLEIKKKLIKTAQEFEKLSINPETSPLNEEQKKSVGTKFKETEARRELYLAMGKASPILRANSTDSTCGIETKWPNSSFDNENYSIEAGVLFPGVNLLKMEVQNTLTTPSKVDNLLKMEVANTFATHLEFDEEASLKNPDKSIRRPDFSEKNSDFSVTYENGIIKFKIKSGPEDSGDNPTTSSGGVSKFDYNKKPNEEELKHLNKESNAYLLNTYTKENEKTKILELLKKASEATIKEFQGKNLDKNFFIAVMRVASEKLGIASNSEEEFNKCFNEALKKIDLNLDATKYNSQEGNTLHKIAKFFSAKFQKFSKDDNYLTPRTDSNVGRRLFRVCTEENIDAFQEMQTKETKGDNGQSPSASPRDTSSKPNKPPLEKNI